MSDDYEFTLDLWQRIQDAESKMTDKETSEIPEESFNHRDLRRVATMYSNNKFVCAEAEKVKGWYEEQLAKFEAV